MDSNNNAFAGEFPAFFNKKSNLPKLHELLDLMYWDSEANEFIPDAVITKDEAITNFKTNFYARFSFVFLPVTVFATSLKVRNGLAAHYTEQLFNNVLDILESKGQIARLATGGVEQIKANCTDAQRRLCSPFKSDLVMTLEECRALAGMPYGHRYVKGGYILRAIDLAEYIINPGCTEGEWYGRRASKKPSYFGGGTLNAPYTPCEAAGRRASRDASRDAFRAYAPW